MPSGAKKRKAAKKKKEKESETTTPQGIDEVKSQDERGSDGGEGGSPSHGEHDDPFSERNEEVLERDPSASDLSAPAAASRDLEEVPGRSGEMDGGKEGVDVIEWDVKSEESCESKDVSVGPVESAKESDRVNGQSGSSNERIVNLDESCNLVKETVSFDELVKSLDSSHANMAVISQDGDSGAESSVNLDTRLTSVSEVKSNDAENVIVEKSMGSQVGVIDLAVKENVDDHNAATTSLEESQTKGSDDKESVSLSRSPIPESTIGAEQIKDLDTPECSENQPLIAPAPHMVQKTSWLNCCGLFEVLTGSNR